MKDYYYILGIDKNATLDEIKQAYRKLSIKFHPEKNEGDKFFEERFKEINEAYEILVDFNKRKVYDDARNFTKSESDYHRSNSNDNKKTNYYENVRPNSQYQNTSSQDNVQTNSIITNFIIIVLSFSVIAVISYWVLGFIIWNILPLLNLGYVSGRDNQNYQNASNFLKCLMYVCNVYGTWSSFKYIKGRMKNKE